MHQTHARCREVTAGIGLALLAGVRTYQRPGRVQQRLGNVLPDTTGEITTPAPVPARARTSAPRVVLAPRLVDLEDAVTLAFAKPR